MESAARDSSQSRFFSRAQRRDEPRESIRGDHHATCSSSFSLLPSAAADCLLMAACARARADSTGSISVLASGADFGRSKEEASLASAHSDHCLSLLPLPQSAHNCLSAAAQVQKILVPFGAATASGPSEPLGGIRARLIWREKRRRQFHLPTAAAARKHKRKDKEKRNDTLNPFINLAPVHLLAPIMSLSFW